MSTRTIPQILDEIAREIDECDQAGFFARIESLLDEIRHIIETAPIRRPYKGLRWRLVFDGHEDVLVGEPTKPAPDLIPGSTLDTAMNMVLREYESAARAWPSMQSAHEGYAVILEELDELWDEVRAQDFRRMEDEAVQVAAMAMRFVIDVCRKPADEETKPQVCRHDWRPSCDGSTCAHCGIEDRDADEETKP